MSRLIASNPMSSKTNRSSSTEPSGLFLSVEGIDGAGKSTMVDVVERWARQQGLEIVRVREPGGTKLGEKLRQVFIDSKIDNSSDVMSDTLMLIAAKHMLYTSVIKPALDAGKIVIADRWSESLFAYQGAGFGLGEETIHKLLEASGMSIYPNLTILLDIPVAPARLRVNKRVGKANAMDKLPVGVMKSIRTCYRKRWQAYRDDASRPIVRVDANSTINMVSNRVFKVLENWYSKRTIQTLL